MFFFDVDAKWLHQRHINGSKFPTWSKKRSAATSPHSAKTEWKLCFLLNQTMPFGTVDAFFLCACVLASHFTVTTAPSILFPGRAPCFDLQCSSLRFFSLFFNTSHALSHFRLPPSSHMQRAHRLPQHQCRHGNLERGYSFSRYRCRSLGPSFVPFAKWRGAQTSAWLLNKRRVYLSRLHISVFYCDLCSRRVRAYNSIEPTQECRTGCGKKIPEGVYMKNKPWGACNWNIRAPGTLNYVLWVQFTPSHTTFLCDLSNFLSL